MKGFRSMWAIGCLCVLVAFYSEKAVGPLLQGQPEAPVTQADAGPTYFHAGNLSDFCLIPNGNPTTIPLPVIRVQLFKWKSWLPEYQLYCWSPGRTNPGFVQDISECPAVAIVLYPYHEFL